MNVGSLGGILGSAAGAPLSQTTGSETERTARDASAQQRHLVSEQNAEKAAGIGTTDADSETSERDADGRRLWESPAQRHTNQTVEESALQSQRIAKDPSGTSGKELDLMG